MESQLNPNEFLLRQNYPNPFNSTTDIRYEIPDSRFLAPTTLKIYNILGQEVKTLVDEIKEAGLYTVTWDGTDNHGYTVASGMYFYRLTAGDIVTTKKIVFLK